MLFNRLAGTVRRTIAVAPRCWAHVSNDHRHAELAQQQTMTGLIQQLYGLPASEATRFAKTLKVNARLAGLIEDSKQSKNNT